LYLFEYQDVSQTNTNIRIIRIIRIMDIRMRTLRHRVSNILVTSIYLNPITKLNA
jgi:hypothetical protein